VADQGREGEGPKPAEPDDEDRARAEADAELDAALLADDDPSLAPPPGEPEPVSADAAAADGARDALEPPASAENTAEPPSEPEPVSEPEPALPPPPRPNRFSGVPLSRTGQRPRRVIAVAGAKGGTGKTVIAVNLAIYLSTLGRTTLLVDADCAGAHLHTHLGLAPLLPAQNKGESDGLLHVTATTVPGLFYLNGGLADGQVGRRRPRARAELFDALADVDCDYVVLDLGAGIEPELLDAYAAADVGLFVAAPEPSAIEGTYRFVRAAFLRRLLNAAKGDEAHALGEDVAPELGGLPVPRELTEALEADDHPLAAEARALLDRFTLHFVINQARVRDDLELGECMRTAAWQRLGVALSYLGYVDDDDTVWACVRERRPLLVRSPGTKASKNIEKLARRTIALDTGKGATPARRGVPPRSHHDLLEVDRGATDEEIRRAHRRMRDVYAEDALCCYGLFTSQELGQQRARLEEAFDVLLDRARRRPYELSIFPDEPAPERDEAPAAARDRELPPLPAIHPETEFDGAMLRAVREAKGLDLKQISRRTKINLSYLEALEADDFGALPALVYVRGFVSEVAKALDLDATQVAHTYVRRVKRNLAESRS
jgi:flagellar biosynthesis protein FlhG